MPQVQFFSAFGTFLFATVGFAMVFALAFFPAALAILGPDQPVC
jgi:hypothetical protein